MAILLVEDDIQVQFLIWKSLKADGFTVLTASSPGIKAVVMSGDLTAREQSESAGLPFLQKPFHPFAVREKIRTVLGSIN